MSETEDREPPFSELPPAPRQPQESDPGFTAAESEDLSEPPIDESTFSPSIAVADDNRWSRPGTPRLPFEPAPRVDQIPARPRGWEWSRNAAPNYPPPTTGLFAPEAIDAPRQPAVPTQEALIQRPATTAGRIGLDLLALFLALFGGLLALVGAFFQELQSGFGILVIILAAPVIEEVLKPSGIYLLLLKWPQALRGRLHTALLCAISGVVFGVIESLIYVQIYYPEGDDSFVLFRFTVTPIMHAIASFIVGAGLTRALIDWANGRGSLPKTTRNCFLAGIGLHAAYNTGAVILSLLGILDFGE